jgi:nitroreductase
LERVIEAALWAPSGMNLQPWELTILTGAQKDEFVAICYQALDYVMPKLRELFPEKQQKLTAQFFKDLGGRPGGNRGDSLAGPGAP